MPGLETLRRRLQGVMVAHQYVLMDYDLPAELVDAASKITPGIESPTVSPLRDTDWVAVRVMVPRDRDAPPDGRAVRARRPRDPGQRDPRRADLMMRLRLTGSSRASTSPPAASSRASTSRTCAMRAIPSSSRKRYYAQGADELTFLDVTATVEDRATMYETVTATAEQVFIPLTVGGGCAPRDDVARLLASGADKVGVNSAAIARPELVDEIADRFGAQVLVLSLDVKRSAGAPTGFVVTTHGGRTETDLDALEWAREAIERGAGELLVNSIDADGTKQGFDLELVARCARSSSVPVIASGGAGALEHFAPAVAAGADAVLAASVFHNGELTVGQVKDALRAEGVEVR